MKGSPFHIRSKAVVRTPLLPTARLVGKQVAVVRWAAGYFKPIPDHLPARGRAEGQRKRGKGARISPQLSQAIIFSAQGCNCDKRGSDSERRSHSLGLDERLIYGAPLREEEGRRAATVNVGHCKGQKLGKSTVETCLSNAKFANI